MPANTTTPQWLLLAHQLPTRPSNARVKTWRRLQQIGAVATRNSVYVLPNTDQCREDFEWLRSEIVALGGEATVFAADVLDNQGANDIVAVFQQTREADYRRLKREADRLMSSARGKRALRLSGRSAVARAVLTLRERFGEIERIDFFNAPGRQDVVARLAGFERAIGRAAREQTQAAQPRLLPADFLGRRWVTRPRPGVDRMASAWLIRRFIDPKATFAFAVKPSASDIAFDMYEGEFSHQGTLCTFETLAQRFGLVAPAVVRIGHIVHDLDMKESRYLAVEAPAVERMVAGLQRIHPDDHVLLDQGIAMFETLARSFDSTEEPASPRRGRARRMSKAKRRSQ